MNMKKQPNLGLHDIVQLMVRKAALERLLRRKCAR